MKFGLKEETIDSINGVFSSFSQIEKAVIYGSRAKGNYRTGSDIDITLLGNDELNLAILLRVMDEIDDLLLPYSFDLSIYSQIDDSQLRDHIDRIGQLFYEKG